MSKEVKSLVKEVFEQECATSPNQRDIIRECIGRNHWIEAPMLVMHSTLEKMYNKFVATMQTVTISLAQFKKIRPFNDRSVKREGCLCKVCESYDNLMSGVEEAVEKLDLSKLFTSSNWSEDHANKKVGQYIALWRDEKDMDRPRSVIEHAHCEGIHAARSFLVTAASGVGSC